MKLQPTADLFGDNSLQCDFLSDTIPSTNNFFSTLKRSQSHSPTNWLTPIIISKAVKSSVKCIVFFFSMFRCYAPVTISMDDWWAKQKDPLELFLKGWENIYIKACLDMNTTPYYVLSQLYNYSPSGLGITCQSDTCHKKLIPLRLESVQSDCNWKM